jgi:hypothetical protein
MNDERMDAAIREQAEAYHRPADIPRDAMWARIQAEREARRDRPVSAIRPRGRWTAVALAIAATLAIGVALGRWSASNPDQVQGTGPTPARVEAAAGAVPAAYWVAADEHLSRVETFLTGFRGDVESGRVGDADLEMPARQLLRRTRLLRQSPAATDDVVLRALLDDIEFVLLQIASFAQVGDARELGFVEQGISQRSVLLRLRSVSPSGPARTASGGAL